MSNLADIIEKFILKKLSYEQSDIVILRRNELADELECAPSQISYVLSTRFTLDRGYVVESRRGLGGYVRIAKLPLHAIVRDKLLERHEHDSEILAMNEIKEFLDRLGHQGMLTSRETALIKYFFDVLGLYIEPEERLSVLRSVLLTLAKNS